MARVKTEIHDELTLAGIDERLSGNGIHLEVDDGVAEFLGDDTTAESDD